QLTLQVNPNIKGIKDFSFDINFEGKSKTFLPTDLNKDGIVDIIDIAIVAKAYGSKPGDPNWNEIADIDKNGVVDILDVSAVARDYGKTST
ncbi:MAG: dockerin type I domain-containing protein, partial [Candidatus Bathyarchaeia archaeon]